MQISLSSKLRRLAPLASGLALLAAVLLTTACSSRSVEPKMGPESARYVGSHYRRTFNTRATAGPPRSAEHPLKATPIPTRPRRTSKGGPVSVPTTGARPAPMVVASQARTPPLASASATAGSASVRTPAGTASVTARAPAASVPVSTPSESTARTQRRFVRMRIHGMADGDHEAPFQVRKILSEAPGVKEVVLSSKTKTAIVVVEPGADIDSVRAALPAPYRAELL